MPLRSPTTSRAAVLTAYGQPLEVRELPVPDPEPGALVVEVVVATVCGTDVHLWEGGLDGHGVGLPVVAGHEGVGRIVAIGAGADRDSLGQDLRRGDRVIWTHGPCGRCVACTVLRRPTLCADRKVGMFEPCEAFPHVGGMFSEFSYVWPESGRVRVPDDVADEHASAGSCALRSAIGVVEAAGPILPTDTVVVQGAGPLGLFSTALASLQSPRRLVVVGGPSDRLAVARQWGATDVIDIAATPTPADRLQRLREITGDVLANVVIEASGVAAAFGETIEMAAPGGRAVIGGIVDASTPLPQAAAHLIAVRGLRIQGSFGGHTDAYWKALEFLRQQRGRFDFDQLITRSYGLADVTTALRRMQAREEIKPVIRPLS